MASILDELLKKTGDCSKAAMDLQRRALVSGMACFSLARQKALVSDELLEKTWDCSEAVMDLRPESFQGQAEPRFRRF